MPPNTSRAPSTSGLSEGTGTKPATGSPTVSPDAPATPETSKGKAEGEGQSSEARATGQPRRGEVGGKLAAGEVVTTSSGRQTTPFPKIDMGTDRKTGSTLKRVDKWLYDNAVEEARARGDDFNLRQFEAEDPAKMPPASKDAMEEYLFGQQPDVVPPIAKPIDTPATSDKPKQGPQPPLGYKPRAEFTPAVTQIKSPDLELRDNIADMKQLKLKLGDAVGYRVYPDPKSTKGGYWEYGTVVSVVGSHAGVK